jgi:hypothetical protein
MGKKEKKTSNGKNNFEDLKPHLMWYHTLQVKFDLLD